MKVVAKKDDPLYIEHIEELDLKDNSNRSLSESMANFIKGKAREHAIGAPHLRADKLALLIEEYLNNLGAVKQDYTRDQLINDLILMVKQGKPQASTILIDMLGFNNAQETFKFNIVNFGDLPEVEASDFREINLSTGKRVQ